MPFTPNDTGVGAAQTFTEFTFASPNPSDEHDYNQAVKRELLRLRSQRAAKRIIDSEALGDVPIPVGVHVDDPLPAADPELIPGILLKHGATGIIGEKEVGKSLVALEIQHCLLTGYPLWGSLEPTGIVDKTIHLLAEHTSYNLHQQYKRLKFQPLPTGKRLTIIGTEHLKDHKVIVSNGIRRDPAVEYYKRVVEGAGLVVFDPLAAFVQGPNVENDNASMRTLIDAMIEISQSTGAACLILGHKGKPTLIEGKPIRRAKYGTRGASAQEDAMTAVHYLEKTGRRTKGNEQIFALKPIHFKGEKRSPFHIVRNQKDLTHTLKNSSHIEINTDDDD